ncbi:DUF418 domain-containing protein [Paenibacillus illinoisensis]|uniref:DUF418 domain-containing protein n=1 Tax=Paenibacillus illinoisensis TaxID=59845 RepID=UPI0037CC3C68
MGAVIALAVYGIQWWLSPLYLKKFRSGPVEYLLRIWTYLFWKGQPRKKNRKHQNLRESAIGINGS